MMFKGLFVSPLWLVIFGFTVGMIAGLFGTGGGFLMTPLLHVVLYLPFELAVGTGVAALLVGTMTATAMYWRGRAINWPAAAIVGLTGALFSQGGVAAVSALQKLAPSSPGGLRPIDLWLSVIYIALLSFVGLTMLLEATSRLREPPAGGCVDTPLSRLMLRCKVGPFLSLPQPRGGRISVWPLALVGAVTGFISGLLGIGGGFMRVPALIYACAFPTRAAAGTSIAAAFMVVIAAAAGHWREGHVNVPAAAVLSIAAAAGALVGAWIAARVRGARIRRWFGLVILATAAMLVLKLLGIVGR